MGASALPLTQTRAFAFKRQLPFRTGSAGLEVTATDDPAVMQAILADAAVPGSGDVELASIAVSAQAGQDVVFTGLRGPVTFGAHGGAQLGLGFYRRVETLLKAARVDEHVAASVALPASPEHYFVLLGWGYDATASAASGAALGPPSIRFSVEAGLAQNYALFRRFRTKTPTSGTGAGTAIADTIDCFVLPANIGQDTDLPPSSWIYTLVDADLKGSLGIAYGYDFNWVREATGAGLKGDIGLKVQASIDASLGFVLTGRWAVLVGRENDDRVVRLRVFKQPTAGWSFALNAGANVTPSTGGLLPERMDDLIAAVLGVYGPQLLKDLGALEHWSSGGTPLSGVLAKVGSGYLLRLLESLHRALNGPTSSFNPDADFTAARDAVLAFLQKWGGLDARLSSLLWKLVPGRDDEGRLRPQAAAVLQQAVDAATAVAGGTREDLARFLSQQPGLAAFFRSPVGELLQELAANGLLAATTESASFAAMQEAARTVLPFLKAATSERALLQALHDWIDPRLGLAAIEKAIQAGTGEIPDDWLRSRLEEFLGTALVGVEELKTIGTLIDTLRKRANDYYDAARKALNTTYGASIAAAYESSATDAAMLDVEFDFGHPRANPARLSSLLKGAIGGDCAELLSVDTPGVTLRQAMLSHGLRRHSHVELRLPFYASTVDHITSSLATARAVEAEGGRMLVCQLDSTDDVARISNRGGDHSRLALAARLPPASGNATRVFGEPAFTYSYSYRQASRRMRREQLQYGLKQYVDEYLGSAFAERPFDTWLGEVDRGLAHRPTDDFGYALVSLDLSLPSAVAAAWLNAPSQERAEPYMEMSRALQDAFRRTVSLYHFADVSRYEDLGAALPLVAFSALPLSTSARLEGGALQLDTGRSVYWDWMDRELRRAFLFSEPTSAKLRAMLPAIYQRLQSAGLPHAARFYRPGDATVRRIRSEVDADEARLKSLLFTEARIVDGALQAGLQIAAFRNTPSSDARQATRALGAFGATVTDTFNARVSSIYGGAALRPLGTQLFVTAAKALSGENGRPCAALHFVALEPQARFAPEAFLEGREPEEGVLVRQTITSAR